MLLYAITNRVLLAETESDRLNKLVALAATWAGSGVDYIQIREKDLSAPDLTEFAAKIVQCTRQGSDQTKILINARPEIATSIALESGADGIHLTGGFNPGQLAAATTQIHEIWQSSQTPRAMQTISVSCHSVEEVRIARAAGVTLALFAPVFEKTLPDEPALSGQGLEALAEACRAAGEPSSHPELPVLALGGVTLENAPQCLAAGAFGIAGIRLFLSADSESEWKRLEMERWKTGRDALS